MRGCRRAFGAACSDSLDSSDFPWRALLLNPLIIVRDVHLGSSVIVAGIVLFDLFVASPVWRTDRAPSQSAKPAFQMPHRRQLLWISLALSIVSALAWLCLLAARIAGKTVVDVVVDGTAWIVLSQTQFGFAWQLRLLFAVSWLHAC